MMTEIDVYDINNEQNYDCLILKCMYVDNGFDKSKNIFITR